MTTKTKKILFWVGAAVVAAALFILLMNKAPWLCIGFAFGWLGRYLYKKYIAKD